MASIEVGALVELTPVARDSLRYMPSGAALRVAVHPAALRAPRDRHTQLAEIENEAVRWLGAMGEDLVAERRDGGPGQHVRDRVSRCILRGQRLWEIVRPEGLLRDGVQGPVSTVYHGARPWLIVGETIHGAPVAVPLNAPSNPKWYSPVVRQSEMSFPGNDQDSQVELAHLWTLSAEVARAGSLLPQGIAGLGPRVGRYFGVALA